MSWLTQVHGTKTLIMALFVVSVLALLLYEGKVSADEFTGVLGIIVGFYFGAGAAKPQGQA